MPDAMIVGTSQSSETTSPVPRNRSSCTQRPGQAISRTTADGEDVREDRLLHPQRDRCQEPGHVGGPSVPRRPRRRGDADQHEHACPGHRTDQRPLRQEQLRVEDRGPDDQRGEDAGDPGPAPRTGQLRHAPADRDHRGDRAGEGNEVDRRLRVPEEGGSRSRRSSTGLVACCPTHPATRRDRRR